MGFGKYVHGLVALAISTAAAALSSTLLKSELLPDQLAWLGTAGTVVAAVMIVISFVIRKKLGVKGLRYTLAALLFLTLLTLIWLRSARVVNIEFAGSTHNFLVGSALSQTGREDYTKCGAESNEQLIGCSGARLIPLLFDGSYWRAYYAYICDYLLMLAIFVLLVSAVAAPPASQQEPVGGD
jgi:hypothetical protein